MPGGVVRVVMELWEAIRVFKLGSSDMEAREAREEKLL